MRCKRIDALLACIVGLTMDGGLLVDKQGIEPLYCSLSELTILNRIEIRLDKNIII